VRLFVAVFPPPETQKALARAAIDLPIPKGFRWTKPENIHLTLKFLGETPEEAVPGITAALRLLSEASEPFTVVPNSLGTFPSVRKARVLWAGIGPGAAPLTRLADGVERALLPLGFEAEKRPYVPHLTLGRTRGRLLSMEGVEMDLGTRIPGFTAHRLVLAKSVPGESGVTYPEAAALEFGEEAKW
jgi:2'-5' RNA ligase